MPLLPVSTAQSTNVLFWVCPCNNMRANPLHSTHIHTRIRFLILLLLISYDIICGCVRGFFFSFQSMFDHDQTKFVLPQYTIKQKRCSNSSPHHLCFLAVNNIAWDAMCAKRIMFDIKVQSNGEWMNQHWFFQYNVTFYARAIIFTFYQILITKNGWTLKTVEQIWTNIYFIMQSYHEFQIGTDVWLNLRKGKENFHAYTFIDFLPRRRKYN